MSQNVRSFVETLDRAAAKQANDEDTYKLLHHLDLAHDPKIGQEAAVDSFAQKLLEKLGYASGYRIILTRQSLPLLICGSNCNAQADVCICDDIILLLVQEDKCLDSVIDPEPQVIAEAIAAYQRNNRTRQRDLHLPILEEMISFQPSHSSVLFLPSTKSRLLPRSTTPLSPGCTLRWKRLFSGTFLDYLVVTAKE